MCISVFIDLKYTRHKVPDYTFRSCDCVRLTDVQSTTRSSPPCLSSSGSVQTASQGSVDENSCLLAPEMRLIDYDSVSDVVLILFMEKAHHVSSVLVRSH